MARLDVAPSGKTLGPVEGFAGLRPADLRYRVRRAALTLVSIGALITSVAATAASLQGVTDPGVEPGVPGQQVGSVARFGFAWAVGIRPGQTVDVLVPRGEPGGYRLETHDASGRHIADASGQDRSLRSSAAVAIA